MLKELLIFRDIPLLCTANGASIPQPRNVLFIGPGGPFGPSGGPDGAPGGGPDGSPEGPSTQLNPGGNGFGGFGIPASFLGGLFGPRQTTAPKNAVDDDDEEIRSSSHLFDLEQKGKLPKWFTNLMDWWDDL